MFNKQLEASKSIAASADDASENSTSNNTSGWSVAWGDSLLVSDSHAGFRFTSIQFPKGSIGTSAVIRLYPYITQASSRGVRIQCNKVDDAPNWSGTGPRSATPTTAYTDWTISSWTKGFQYNSPDITSPMEEVLERSGWSNGNDIGVIFEPKTSFMAIIHEAFAIDEPNEPGGADYKAQFYATATHGALGGIR